VRLSVDGYNVLIVVLEYLPRSEAVSWASGIVDANPDADTIILTHHYLNPDGTRCYGLGDGRSGEDLWNDLIKRKPNIIAVICGHKSVPPYTAHRTDPGDAGNVIHQILIDYQYNRAGDGWIGLLKFRPSRGTMEMSSYRTYAPSGLGYDPNAPTYSLPWLTAHRTAAPRQEAPTGRR